MVGISVSARSLQRSEAEVDHAGKEKYSPAFNQTCSTLASIKFSNSSGFSVTERAIRVGLDGTVVAAVPLYLDPSGGQFTQAAVQFVLTQGNQSTTPTMLNIRGLPP